MNSAQIMINEHKELLLELNEIELQIAALKLRSLLEQNRFPEWVADSWVDSNKKRAIPLKNGFWLRTYHIYTPQADAEAPETIYYSGRMCDENGKIVGGVTTVNVNDSDVVDMNIWKDLVTFAEAYKKTEDTLIHNKVSIDNEIQRLTDMLKNGDTTLGRLEAIDAEKGAF